jgi:hypothetical protein
MYEGKVCFKIKVKECKVRKQACFTEKQGRKISAINRNDRSGLDFDSFELIWRV